MDNFKITKWMFSQFWGIAGVVAALVGIVAATVTLILQGVGAVNTLLLGCSTGDIGCLSIKWLGIATGTTLGILAILFIISIILDLILKTMGVVYSNSVSWLENPNEKNIILYPFGYRRGVYTLKFRCKEWRYLFKKTEALVTIPSMFKSTIIENLEWSNENTTKPIAIKRFSQYELNFIKIDPIKDVFSVITNTDKEVSFGKGEYVFDVGCLVTIYGNFQVKDNIFVKSLPFRVSPAKIQYIKVSYSGGYAISFSVLREKPQEEAMWYSKNLSLAQ